MSDDVAELKKKLAEIERRTVIGLSILAALLLVFLAAWIASSLWLKARLEARVERAEKAARAAEERIGKARAGRPEIVEAESFVVKDLSGHVRASFGVGGTTEDGASLAFFDASGQERTRIEAGLLQMSEPGQKKDEKRAVSLTADDDGPALFLTERDGKTLLSAWISERSRPLVLSGAPVTVVGGKAKAGKP